MGTSVPATSDTSAPSSHATRFGISFPTTRIPIPSRYQRRPARQRPTCPSQPETLSPSSQTVRSPPKSGPQAKGT